MASFTTSKSTLMHAVLASISPELSTFNDIILQGHRPLTPSTPRLPTEILLLIREWLLPAVTAARVAQSRQALTAYEHALRDLLCPDCILYNIDIYGPNIWEWEQFTSACSCREPSVPRGYRNSSPPANTRTKQVCDDVSAANGAMASQTRLPSTSSAQNVNPKQFLDAEHWLEWHLSREAALCVGYRGHEASPGDSASEASQTLTAPVIDIDIWHVVASVLREFSCEAVREPEVVFVHERSARGQFRTTRDDVTIVPLRGQIPDVWDKGVEGAAQEKGQLEMEWETERRLRRASRELGLLFDHEDPFRTHASHILPPVSARRLRWPSVSNSCYSSQDLVDTSRALLRISLAIAAGLVSAPLTLTTFVLTVLCYYSRPKSFRML